MMKAGLILLALFAAVNAQMQTVSITVGGMARTYYKYVPANGGVNGVMIYLDGVGHSGLPNYQQQQWGVISTSDTHGFVGIIGQGSPLPGEAGSYRWNIDEPSGPNEVAYVHAVIAEVVAAHSIPTNTPRIALGFSNGAGLAGILGCHNSNIPYVAHLAAHIASNSDYPSTCTPAPPPNTQTTTGKGGRRLLNTGTGTRLPVYGAIGENDFFLSSLGSTGAARLGAVRAQFHQLHDALGCAAQDWTTATGTGTAGTPWTSYRYTQCPSAGILYLYGNGLTHAVEGAMAGQVQSSLS